MFVYISITVWNAQIRIDYEIPKRLRMVGLIDYEINTILKPGKISRMSLILKSIKNRPLHRD